MNLRVALPVDVKYGTSDDKGMEVTIPDEYYIGVS